MVNFWTVRCFSNYAIHMSMPLIQEQFHAFRVLGIISNRPRQIGLSETVWMSTLWVWRTSSRPQPILHPNLLPNSLHSKITRIVERQWRRPSCILINSDSSIRMHMLMLSKHSRPLTVWYRKRWRRLRKSWVSCSWISLRILRLGGTRQSKSSREK